MTLFFRWFLYTLVALGLMFYLVMKIHQAAHQPKPYRVAERSLTSVGIPAHNCHNLSGRAWRACLGVEVK